VGTSWTADRRILAAGMVTTVVLGFSVAAAVDALAAPDVPVADGWGPDDGLTRWVLGTADPAALVAAAEATPGVASAQPLFDGGVLVAADTAGPSVLAAIPGVVSVEPSVSAQVMADPTDPYWSTYGWDLENTGRNAYGQAARADADLDATTGWTATTGAGEVVAVLDSGYDLDHPDMAGALWTNPAEPCGAVDTDGNGKAGDCHGWDFTRDAPITDATDSGSHGVSVAGVIAARAGNGTGSAGVAPDVTIMPLVIGSGSTVDVNLGAQAIRYAVDHGATVINASWGGPTLLPALQSAVAYAGAHDVLVVAAAGNDAVDRDATPMYPASLPDPAIVSVGSSTASDTMSSFSAWGATSVDLMAPGTLVFTTWPDGGYRLVSGTSIAAPETAAVVAQYRSLMPSATAAELKQALLADVDPVPAFAGRSVTGGRLSTDGLPSLGAQEVRWTYTGMTGAPGPLTPALTTSTSLPAGDYTAVIGLGMRVGGQVYAVSGQPFAVGGTTRTTDDTGTVSVPLGTRGPSSGALVVNPGTTLTEGRYVLTVQLLQDGAPLGRASAAPLTVGAATASPTTSTGPSVSAPTSSTATPTGSPGATPAPTGSGGSGGSGGSRPSSSGTPSSGASTSGAPSSSRPSPAAPTTAAGPTTSAAPSTTSAPTGTGTPGASSPARTTAAPTTTGTVPTSAGRPTTTGAAPTTSGAPPTGTGGAPSATASPTGGTTAPPSGSTSYPGTGDFRVTSMSPTTVDAAGGAAVTVLGTFAAEPRVLVGSSGLATVVSWSSMQVVFTAPRRVPGTYTVLLSSTSGTQRSQLNDALTYVSTTPAPSGGASPTAATPTAAVPTATPTATGPVVVTGPGGQRLVGTVFFSSLPAAVWSVNCSTSCSGMLI